MFFKKKEIKEIERNIIEIEKSYARNLLPIRYPNSNKGTYGTVLNIKCVVCIKFKMSCNQ